MGKSAAALTAALLFGLTINAFIVSTGSAIGTDLAKKCRELAVKAHPPPNRLGGHAYAKAERDFFTECVSKDGHVDEMAPPKGRGGPTW